MKKNILIIMTLCLVLIGCSKDTKTDTYTLKKKEMYILSLSEIVKKYQKEDLSKNLILWRLHSPKNSRNLENIYRIAFPLIIMNSNIKSSILSVQVINVDLCKNGIKQTSSNKNLEIQEFLFHHDNKATCFISLERLKKKHLVTQEPSKQEDICLYMNKSISYNTNDEAIKKSNVITFTAEEINNIRAEYESLTQ
jgi:hypothetical protein